VQFAELAARAMTPKPRPVVAIDHLHAPQVSVREQAVVLATRLREVGAATFRGLTADAHATIVVVARFLALLELYREGAVAFEQVAPLGELHVRWVGSPDADAELDRWAHETGEPDEYDATGVVAAPDNEVDA
jgi:segregation and condensation protein A